MTPQLRSKLYRLQEIESAASEASKASASASAQPRRDWVECGVGQAKILLPQGRESGEEPAAAARVVMRREPGTSVLINARLKPPVVAAAKHADKALRLTCLDEKGQPSTFLFRVRKCVRPSVRACVWSDGVMGRPTAVMMESLSVCLIIFSCFNSFYLKKKPHSSSSTTRPSSSWRSLTGSSRWRGAATSRRLRLGRLVRRPRRRNERVERGGSGMVAIQA